MAARPRVRMGIVIATVVAGGAMARGPQGPPTLPDVLSAVGTYLADYETTASAVLAEERYQQSATRAGSRQQQRILRSDVLMLHDRELGWIWMRDVLEVDGTRVPREPDRLLTLVTAPPANASELALRIVAEGVGYHLGSALRTTSAPTMALVLIQREHQVRSRFSLDGMKTLGGTKVAVLAFKEDPKSPLILSFDRAAAEGRFWIEPATGRVVQTEVTLQTMGYAAKITVRYANDPRLGFWVPVRMDEEYQGGEGTAGRMPPGSMIGRYNVSELITGRADYRNFRKLTPTANSPKPS